MQNYVQRGNHLTVPAAPYALTAGQGALVGSIFGVASNPAASGAEVVLTVVGIFTLPKTSALSISFGDALYWDNTARELNKTSSGNTRVGVAVADAANPSATVLVRLNGSY